MMATTGDDNDDDNVWDGHAKNYHADLRLYCFQSATIPPAIETDQVMGVNEGLAAIHIYYRHSYYYSTRKLILI